MLWCLPMLICLPYTYTMQERTFTFRCAAVFFSCFFLFYSKVLFAFFLWRLRDQPAVKYRIGWQSNFRVKHRRCRIRTRDSRTAVWCASGTLIVTCRTGSLLPELSLSAGSTSNIRKCFLTCPQGVGILRKILTPVFNYYKLVYRYADTEYAYIPVRH